MHTKPHQPISMRRFVVEDVAINTYIYIYKHIYISRLFGRGIPFTQVYIGLQLFYFNWERTQPLNNLLSSFQGKTFPNSAPLNVFQEKPSSIRKCGESFFFTWPLAKLQAILVRKKSGQME